MESNKNNDNNGGEEHEQLQARKRTFNALTNDEDKSADEDQQQEPENCSKKNREEANDMDLESWKQETPTTITDLPPSSGRHRKLPPELNCQIFYCFNLPTRLKFICGLGWDFYAMFRRSLLIKSKRLRNAKRNGWSRSNGNVKISEGSNGNVTISEDGLIVTNNTNELQHLHAKKRFPISVADCRKDHFPGTICYYYEVKSLSDGYVIEKPRSLVFPYITRPVLTCKYNYSQTF